MVGCCETGVRSRNLNQNRTVRGGEGWRLWRLEGVSFFLSSFFLSFRGFFSSECVSISVLVCEWDEDRLESFL